MTIDIDIDDVIDNCSITEVLDYYDIDDIIEYVERKSKNKSVLNVEAVLKDIAATRMSPNLISDKELVRRTLSEIINEIF